jgi:hypothetical protein
VAEDAFQLTPAHASARLRALQRKRLVDPQADDPLVPAHRRRRLSHERRERHDYTTLVQDGLVRIAFPLPSNVRLVSPVGNSATAPLTDETTVDIWRSVPSVLDVRSPDRTASFPNGKWRRRTDAVGISSTHERTHSQEQALGAFVDHAQVVVLPDMRTLDDLAAFQNSLFSSHRIAKLAEAMAAGTSPLPDPDPGLNRLERQGKAVFERSCAHCHGNPEHPSTTTSLPQSISRNRLQPLPRRAHVLSQAESTSCWLSRGALAAVLAQRRQQDPDVRDHLAQRDSDPSKQLRPWPSAAHR